MRPVDFARFEPDPEPVRTPLFGPTWRPSARQGISSPCGCHNHYGESCPECSGSARDERELAGCLTRRDRAQIAAEEARQETPPCMRPTHYTEEASA